MHISKTKKVLAAFLQIDSITGNPILKVFSPDIACIDTKWNYISFKDGTIDEIVNHVKCGRWHYHEKRTGVWQESKRKMLQMNWPDSDIKGGSEYNMIPVFLTKSNHLRYTRYDLPRFCYSVRELYGNGLPEKGGWYPIANVNAESIWIEMLPGKILDIPKKFLFVGDYGRSLENMATEILGVGDEIKLGEKKNSADEKTKLLVENVHFGIRAMIQSSRAYMPVERVQQGGITLGGGIFCLTFPEDNTEVWLKGDLGRLEQSNTLLRCDKMPGLQEGDVVLLGYNSKHDFEIKGMPHITAKLAYESLWQDSEWLYEYLWNRNTAVDNIFRDGLPIKVNNVRNESGQLTCYVFYTSLLKEQFDEGTEICCNVVGKIVNKRKTSEIVLRAGGYIFKMSGKEFMPGVQETNQDYVCRFLSENKTLFWMHRSNGNWKLGLHENDEIDTVQLELLACIPQAEGIICRDTIRCKLWWLPVKQAARVENVPVEFVFAALKKKKDKRFMAKIMKDGTVSLLHTPESNTRFATIEIGNKSVRVIPLVQLPILQEETYHYLGELSPCGDVIRLVSEYQLHCHMEEPVCVNVVKKKEQEMVVVPVEMHREKLNLSPWVIEAYRKSFQNKRFFGEFFVNFRPERYTFYEQVIERSIQDAETGLCRMENMCTEEQLIYLYSLISNRNFPADKKGAIYDKVRKILIDWVGKTGLSIATGFDSKYSKTEINELDLLPTLAAILLLNRIRSDEEKCKKLAVHLTRVLGMLCNNSMHQEYILRNWLLQKEKGELWKRLSKFSLGGENIEGQAMPLFDGTLTVKQKRNIVYGCRNIKNRNQCPKELRMVSECLLFAMGVEEDYSLLYQNLKREKSLVCSRMAHLYKGFLPGTGLLTAAAKIDRDTFYVLDSCYRQLARRDNFPVTLITQNVFPLRESEKKWSSELRKTVLR